MVNESPGSGCPRILIIAPHGSYRSSAFIDAAQRLGGKALIASEGAHSVVSAYAEGLHLPLDDDDTALQRILRADANEPFAAILGTDDSTTELAARASQALGLPHNPLAAVRYGRRKDLARQRLSEAGVPVPAFHILDCRVPLAPQINALHYPLVLKPVALSGSRGVIRVDDREALVQAVARVQQILQAEGALPDEIAHTLLLEQFIPGQEVALEGLLVNGHLQTLTVFDKPDPLDGPFFEETYYITPSRHSAQQLAQLARVVQAACHAYGLREGPVHAECRLNDSGAWVLEVAARTIGGLCARLVQFSTGFSLEELVLSQAMGHPVRLAQGEGGAGVLMIPIPRAGLLKRIEGLLAAQQVPFIESIEIQIREGCELVPLPEGSSYLGFIFARAPTAAQAEAALRKAHACLNIVVAPLWKVSVA